jgi:hypothetical protein
VEEARADCGLAGGERASEGSESRRSGAAGRGCGSPDEADREERWVALESQVWVLVVGTCCC